MSTIEGLNKNYATQYEQVIDAKFAPQRYSNDLWNSPLNSEIHWDGLHVKIPTLSVDGGSTNRETGGDFSNNYADISNDYEDMMIRFARMWKAKVDPVDVMGTNAVVTMANVTNLHNQDTVVEDDSYMFSTLFKEKQRINALNGTPGRGIKNKQLDETNILDVIDDLSDQMDESRVTGQKVLYVTPRVKRLINTANVANRAVTLSGDGDLNTEINSIDDIQIKKVPAYLMKTSFDFTKGVKDDPDASQIDMFMIVNGCQASPKRYSWAGLQDASALTDGQIVYYEMRLEDVFMLKNKADAYAAVIHDGSNSTDSGNSNGSNGSNNQSQTKSDDSKSDDKSSDSKSSK